MSEKEIWEALPDLRWHCHHVLRGRARHKEMKLQQAWRELNSNKVEWRDVPEHWERSEET